VAVYDVAVVGAGVVGLATARSYARLGASVIILERHPGPGREQSTHNSGVVHSGAFLRPGTLRAHLGVEGNRRMFDEAPRLGVAIEQCGTLVVARTDEHIPRLWEYQAWAAENAVPGARRLTSEEAHELEPNLGLCAAAMLLPTGGRVDAPGLVRALDRELADEGVDRRYDFDVAFAARPESDWELSTRVGETVSARLVVNSAGVGSARVAALLGEPGRRVYPCLGEYARIVGDKRAWLRAMIYGFPPPGFPGIGVHLTRTTSREVLIGPTARYQQSPEAPPVPVTSLETFAELAGAYLPGVTPRDLEPAAAGVRAKTVPPGSGEAFGDFEIFEAPAGSRAVHLFGVESPGLTAAFAIAEHVTGRWPAPRS
jgi:L-2-hydroxyglutarate oxidase LhgO